MRSVLVVGALLLAPVTAAADDASSSHGVLIGDVDVGLGLDDAPLAGSSNPKLSAFGCVQVSAGAGWRSGTFSYLLRARLAYAPIPDSGAAVRNAAIGFAVQDWLVIPFVNQSIVIEAGAGVGMFDRKGRESLGGGFDAFGGVGLPLRSDHSLVLDLRFTSTSVLSNDVWIDVLELGGSHHFATFALGLEWRS